MPSAIQTKYSTTAAAAPTTGDCTVPGELAVNVTDKKLYTRNGSDAIVQVGEQDGTADGAVKYWNNTTKQWVESSAVLISPSTGQITISAANNLIISNLPTSDPLNTGEIWNDSGTLKVSS